MQVCKDGNQAVNFDEIARCTDDFNGAMLKAVCVEAGMIALRRGATELQHEDFMEGVSVVQAKKNKPFNTMLKEIVIGKTDVSVYVGIYII